MPALLAAALALPALAPAARDGAERAHAGAAVDAENSAPTALELLLSSAPERGPLRHDESRRLDASLASAALVSTTSLPGFGAHCTLSRPRERSEGGRLARWCLAHATSTAAP